MATYTNKEIEKAKVEILVAIKGRPINAKALYSKFEHYKGIMIFRNKWGPLYETALNQLEKTNLL